MRSTSKYFIFLSAAAICGLVSMPAHAKELTITSSNLMKLSEAVADVYAADDGPDIINIEVDSLPMDDTTIYLTQAITINGDADANGEKCDILVDITAIRASDAPDPNAYIDISSTGNVTINDLKIHPNFDNVVVNTGNHTNLVDAIRINRSPVETAILPVHTLARVWVSGSDASDNYVPLDTADDLYNMPGVKKWSRQSGTSSHGIINLSKSGDGLYNAVLDNCHAGLGYGDALNIPAEGGHVTVIGGLYGHSGNNGLRVSGDVVTLTGSHTNRLRIVNVPNIGGTNSHGIANAIATFDRVEWVDIASINTGRNVQVNGAIPMPMNNCRLMGSLSGSGNPMLYLTNPNSTINMVDCTMVGSSTNNNPIEIRHNSEANNTFTNCIFVSDELGQIMYKNEDNVGTATFTNCGIPTDGFTGESLNTSEPISADPLVTPATYTVTDSVSASPRFMLTLADYDWSENQGAGQTGNDRGNVNVFRPSDPAYQGASNDGSNLVGGAGDYPARIEADVWMLM